MYHKILIPLDRSQESEGVLPLVGELLESDGELILLNIIPPGRTRSHGDAVILGSQQEEGDRNRAMVYLRSAASQLAEVSVKSCCAVMVSGSVAEGIVKFAEQENADLIMMFTHDRKGLAKMIRGSIAEKVQQRAPTEVRTVKRKELVPA